MHNLTIMHNSISFNVLPLSLMHNLTINIFNYVLVKVSKKYILKLQINMNLTRSYMTMFSFI